MFPLALDARCERSKPLGGEAFAMSSPVRALRLGCSACMMFRETKESRMCAPLLGLTLMIIGEVAERARIKPFRVCHRAASRAAARVHEWQLQTNPAAVALAPSR